MLAPCWHTFGIKVMFVRNRLFDGLLKLIVIDLLKKKKKGRKTKIGTVSITFLTLFPNEFLGTSLGSLWQPLGSIVVVCVTFSAPF